MRGSVCLSIRPSVGPSRLFLNHVDDASGLYIIELLLIPPCLEFSSPRRIAVFKLTQFHTGLVKSFLYKIQILERTEQRNIHEPW